MNVETKEIEFLKKVFKKFDANNTGHLSADQYTKFVKTLSKQIPELEIDAQICEAIFASLDKDRNGVLSFEEIRQWWVTHDKFKNFIGKRAELMKKARALFLKYSGTNVKKGMNFSEFEKLLMDHKINHDESAFDLIDKDEDGLISFNEFIEWLNWV
jgi:Ca2+-binding EF-hand superfamily protein